jgi:hypothetical protein
VTEQQRREIKVKLIELEFWGATDYGDPTTDDFGLGVLIKRMEKRLAPGCRFSIDFADNMMVTREVRVLGDGIDKSVAVGEDLSAAICLAALALPEFLKRNPECSVKIRV